MTPWVKWILIPLRAPYSIPYHHIFLSPKPNLGPHHSASQGLQGLNLHRDWVLGCDGSKAEALAVGLEVSFVLGRWVALAAWGHLALHPTINVTFRPGLGAMPSQALPTALRWGSWAVCDPGSGIVGGGMRAGMAEALTEGRWPCQREVGSFGGKACAAGNLITGVDWGWEAWRGGVGSF